MFFVLSVDVVLVVFVLVGVMFVIVLFNLLVFDVVIDYCLKIFLWIYMVDGVLFGEFGEECWDFMLIVEILLVLKDVLLVIEDVCFYEYSGVDY